jgi:hypothetical protein
MADREPDGTSKARKPRRAGSGGKTPYPADKRPTDPDAIERSDLPERDKQYGSDDN